MDIAVLFGGRSCEHDISIITAVQAMAHLDPEKYSVRPVYMKDGDFYTGDCLKDIDFYIRPDIKKCTKLRLTDGQFRAAGKGFIHGGFKPDAALICCHGGEGENGVLQGLLEFNNIPYTSADVCASAVCMDKVVTKQLINGLMLNAVDEISFTRADFEKKRSELIRHIETYIDYPMIIKPCSLGSSIGIKRAECRDKLITAIEIAAKFDIRIIVERALDSFVELNCAVVSDGVNIIPSEVEKPITWRDFLTFEDKYMAGGKGMKGELRELPAKIDGDSYDLVRKTSARLYEELNMSGVIRIDYFLSADKKLYVNEINTVPGSLSFYLFEPMGMSFSELLDMLIDGALYKQRAKNRCVLAYNSEVLKNFNGTKNKRLQK